MRNVLSFEVSLWKEFQYLQISFVARVIFTPHTIKIDFFMHAYDQRL